MEEILRTMASGRQAGDHQGDCPVRGRLADPLLLCFPAAEVGGLSADLGLMGGGLERK